MNLNDMFMLKYSERHLTMGNFILFILKVNASGVRKGYGHKQYIHKFIHVLTFVLIRPCKTLICQYQRNRN